MRRLLVPAVAAAENLCPSVRVASGALYRFVGHNRLAAAGIEGALLGATLGNAIFVAGAGRDPADAGLRLLIGAPLAPAVAFAAAEAAVVWVRSRLER